MTEPADIAMRLESCFRKVQATRMAGVPILNEALGVSAVGFHPWNGYFFGVLVTPWFMNAVLLPEAPDGEAIRAGEKRLFAFPGGTFEFIRGHEDDLGPFWMCSLFSPVFEFSDMETAALAAEAALAAMLESAGDDPDRDMQRIWRGELPEDTVETQTAEDAVKEHEVTGEAAAERSATAAGMSRRGLLTGGLGERKP